MNRVRLRPTSVAAVVVLTLLGARMDGRRDVPRMTEAARAFLGSLDDAQRAAATFDFDADERSRFHFIPNEAFERRGVLLKELDGAQRELARDLLRAGLSQRGFMTAEQIMELEDVLRALEGEGRRAARDPDEYWVSVFGEPAPGASWGWRFEGHHISLHFTVVEGDVAVAAPAFLGANPAEVRAGPQRGRRPLGDREDAARALVRSLDASQLEAAIIEAEAPRDIVTGNASEVDRLSPVGLAVADMTGEQRSMLMELVDVYLALMSDEIAAYRRQRLLDSDVQRLTFAWAGGVEAGEAHYYRVQGPSFLIEYDNTQNDANHIHSVWRDFDGDWGRDLLREHRQRQPHD